jgi:L-lysine exporter family protein LysE/ArgO
MLFAFLNGLYLGLGLVMPLGPLNLFILNNSSLQKRFVGILPVVLASTLCDISLIFGAVQGVDLIAQNAWIKLLLMFVGIIFLSIMGIKMWKLPSRTLQVATPVRPVSTQIFYSMGLALFNPHAILDTFVIIGAVSATFVGIEKHAFTCGCMFSDFAWFAFLGTLGYFLNRLKKGPKIFSVIDKISALIMLLLALQLTIDLIRELPQAKL